MAVAEESERSTYRKETAEGRSAWRGLKLHITKWLPPNPRALFYISHGVGEHMGRYEQLAECLATNSILVFGHDHVGHGLSEGDRAYIEDYQQYVQDVVHTVEAMKKDYPDLPCFLMGHSMGGMIATMTALNCQETFKGLFLSSPMMEISSGWLMQTIAKIIAAVAPQFGVKKLDTSDISSIPEEVQAYIDDPLIYHGAMKAGWAAASLRAVSNFRPQVKDIQLPLLLIHGTDDRLVPISGSDYVAQTVSSSTVQYEKFTNSRHEVFHDIEQTKARKLVKEWILSILQ